MMEVVMKFLACVGYVERVTYDGRTLARPANGEVQTRPLPLPILKYVKNPDLPTDERPYIALQVGEVRAVALFGENIVVGGTLKPIGAHELAKNPQARLNLDLSDLDVIQSNVMAIRFVYWSVAGLTLTDRPAWPLPAPVIFDDTEKVTVDSRGE